MQRTAGDQPGDVPGDVRRDHEHDAGDQVRDAGGDHLDRVEPLQARRRCSAPAPTASGCPGRRRSSRRRRRSRRLPSSAPGPTPSPWPRRRWPTSAVDLLLASTIRISATAMKNGTIALNAEAGSVSSRIEPSDAAAERGAPDRQHALALADQLAAVADRARDRSGHQPDRVRDVRGDRRVAEREQRREGDERAAADDRVDRARGDSGGEDRHYVPGAQVKDGASRRGWRRRPSDADL